MLFQGNTAPLGSVANCSITAIEFIAAAAAELGDTTTMYRWLDTGQRERSGFALTLGIWGGPFLAHRQEPHFQRILKQMGVTPVTISVPPKR